MGGCLDLLEEKGRERRTGVRWDLLVRLEHDRMCPYSVGSMCANESKSIDPRLALASQSKNPPVDLGKLGLAC